MKKFLCICEGGNVRSVGLAYILKQIHGQDALAASWRFNSSATLRTLVEWADYIVLMQPKFGDLLGTRLVDDLGESQRGPYLERVGPKVRFVDVGEDRFGYAFHPELQGGLQPVVREWATKDFVL